MSGRCQDELLVQLRLSLLLRTCRKRSIVKRFRSYHGRRLQRIGHECALFGECVVTGAEPTSFFGGSPDELAVVAAAK